MSEPLNTVASLAERFQLSTTELLDLLREAGFEQTSGEDAVDIAAVLAKPVVRDALMESRRPQDGEQSDQVVVKLERRTSSTLRTGSRASARAVTVERRGQRTYAKSVERDPQKTDEVPAGSSPATPSLSPVEPPAVDVDVEELRRNAVRDNRGRQEQKSKEQSKEGGADSAAPGRGSPLSRQAPAARQSASSRRATTPTSRRRARLAPRAGEKHQVDARHLVEQALRETAAETVGHPAAGSASAQAAGISSGVLKIVEQRHHAFRLPQQPITRTAHLKSGQQVAVADLARRLSVKLARAQARLAAMGLEDAERIDTDTAVLLAEDLGHHVEVTSERTLASELDKAYMAEGTPTPRPPVVAVMGHVDHGKTSLLDQFRQSSIAATEAGGITQHIGAYQVPLDDDRTITFIDTPGHEAFSAMRARGACCTDLVVLVVAADDGVMPQTLEAVEHVRAAGVPLVVAINKMDREDANPERVKQDLAALEVVPDEWGGEVQFVPVSALSGDGVDTLLEAIQLQAELLELRAPPDVPAWGTVIESRVDTHRGVIASLLVQGGTLQPGALISCGGHSGRLRDMRNASGTKLREALPSTPVEVLALSEPPEAGEPFLVVADERRARELAALSKAATAATVEPGDIREDVEALFAGLQQGEVRELLIVLRVDVQGSLEALRGALSKLAESVAGVDLRILAAGVGAISTSDINLAHSSKALVLGFNVRATPATQKLAQQYGVTLNYYSIIYELTEDVQNLMLGLRPPELSEHILGVAEVRDVFSAPRFGQIAGCMVVEGEVLRNKPVRVLRDSVVIFEGQLDSLRRFKDDVATVSNGTECGIGVRNYDDVRPGDRLEIFEEREVVRGTGTAG